MPDREILRDLAKRYMEICSAPEQKRRRDLWRKHNSLVRSEPPIYVRAFAWGEMPESKLSCADPFLREFENFFRMEIFRSGFDDDYIFEPWITLRASYKRSGWGVDIQRHFSDEPGGSYKADYPIKTLEDIRKLREPRHEIDEEATARNAAVLNELMGDIITVNIDRGPAWRMWTADLSTDLGHLRGMENIMLDMMDNPDWLHKLCSFMSRGVLNAQDEAEAAGDWGLCAHQNQAMPYALELPDPAPNSNGAKRKQLWGYMAAQEFTLISPAQHGEFLLNYQLPILEKFGLTAYGCCEDLTRKIDMLRKIPNLRRIAVSPFADAAKCAEQIGDKYVLSYRPSPADMVSYGFDPARIEKILRRDLGACRANSCHTDVTLKDVETVERDPRRVKEWVKLTRKIICGVFG
jgi:hypothetical protein